MFWRDELGAVLFVRQQENPCPHQFSVWCGPEPALMKRSLGWLTSGSLTVS